MVRIFDNYESLKCDVCSKDFIGRKPAEGGDILCPECLLGMSLSLVDEGDPIPSTVVQETHGGRGND